MVCGGSESVITPLSIAGFSNMGALSANNDDPQTASRPFDATRNGFVMGEGSGILILEDYEHARNRGANILAEIVGYGLSGDAFHITSPGPGGEGLARAIRMALRGAGLSPGDIDYVNAHGTSTPLNDKLETQALKAVFGDHAYKMTVSSNKSMIGHLIGAAGGVESVATVMTIRENKIPPTINLHNADPECDLDYVPNQVRDSKVDVAMTNNLGFGGHNASLIFRKFVA
jgi:3-oxoacyl-[acyl-carrier-protein] synthase II